MSEEHDALAQRSWELASQQNPDALEEVYATSSVWHEPDQDVQAVEEAKQYYSTRLSAFPDPSVTVEDVIVDGEKVVSRWTVGGMNRRAVKVLAALALCGLAVSLVLLLAPDISWAAVLKWLTTSGPSPCEYLR
jgi:predicted ester cyclase